ncbi:MAG: SDR family oxidoreductase [Planctomycetes bacterium]|nr:SDR family oxidoreductase [Planctomycetota bacterium]
MASAAQSPRKRVLVTGASRGIGRAVAKVFLENDWEVALCARSAAGLEIVARTAGLPRGVARSVPCDLSNRASSDAALGALLESWGHLDGVVLSHALNIPTPLSGSLADFERMIEADLVSPLRILRQLTPALQQGGRVVLIGSVLGRFGVPGQHGYCAAKAGMAGIARSLALDLAPKQITVNCVQPGWVDTEMANEAIAAQCSGMGMSATEARAHFEAQLPLKRFLAPHEIAAHVHWLFSTAASGLTGQAQNHDCGVMA